MQECTPRRRTRTALLPPALARGRATGGSLLVSALGWLRKRTERTGKGRAPAPPLDSLGVFA